MPHDHRLAVGDLASPAAEAATAACPVGFELVARPTVSTTAMTDERMALKTLVEKTSNADFATEVVPLGGTEWRLG